MGKTRSMQYQGGGGGGGGWSQLNWYEGGPGNIFDKKAGLGTQASSIKVEINVLTIFSS